MPEYNIEILSEAEADINNAVAFYEDQQEGLGRRLLDQLTTDIRRLKNNCGIHARYFGTYRSLVQRFPYAIYYDMKSNTIRVIAVLDCRQHPSATIERLKHRRP